MKKLLLLLGLWAWALAPAPAAAQSQPGPCGINTVPQIGVNCTTLKQYTYSTTAIGLVPASAATDLFCIGNSASKSISIKEIDISGYSTTAITESFSILRRQALDTSGTIGTGTASAAANVAVNVTSNPSPYTAQVSSYTANPTVVDTSPTYLRSFYLTLNTSQNTTSPQDIIFGDAGVDTYTQGADLLKGVTGEICVNMNAGTVAGGLLDINATWTEN